MNIIFITDVSIQDEISGAERVLFEQTTRLAARGHQVHILTRRLKNHVADQAVIQGVHEWRYPVNQDNAASFLASTLRNGKRLFETLNDTYQFDCINFHQPFSALAALRSDACKKIRKVYTCHSLSFEEYVSRNARPPSLVHRIAYLLNRTARKWIEKQVLNKSDHIVVLSQYTLDKIVNIHHIPIEKIAIVPGGIDLTRFHPATDKTAVRDRLNLPREKMILLTIRDLEPRMGIENLIRAIQNVANAIPDIYLIIGGSGPLKEHLTDTGHRLKLDHLIKFTGFIPEETLPEYYRAADVFVLPTVELEGFGLVTLEALASGTPVLGTPVGGTQEILSRFDKKFLFDDSSSESISRLLTKTCQGYRNKPDDWHDDSRRCRHFSEEHYSWETNIAATERLFSDNIHP